MFETRKLEEKPVADIPIVADGCISTNSCQNEELKAKIMNSCINKVKKEKKKGSEEPYQTGLRADQIKEDRTLGRSEKSESRSLLIQEVLMIQFGNLKIDLKADQIRESRFSGRNENQRAKLLRFNNSDKKNRILM